MTVRTYLGNSALKAAGQVMHFEPWQVEEILKCMEDPIYFIETYVKIVTLDHGLVPFKLYDFQRDMVLQILKNKKTIIMATRQSAKTTTTAACILHYVLFNDYKTVAVLAHKEAGAAEVLRRVQLMYENLPQWLQKGVVTWNKGDIELENGSIVFTRATSSSAITGKSVNFLYVDEAAVIPNNLAEDFFASAYPTLSSGKSSQIVMTSTPRGYNHFWKFWNDAEQGINGFHQIRVDWWQVPGRDEKWLEDQRKILGETKFQSEIMNSFIGSSLTLIDSSVIATLSYNKPEYSKDSLDIYEVPQQGHTYMMTVDTSKGIGGDYSTFSVFDITTTPYKVVAKYRNAMISPQLFPNVINKVARQYNDAFVLVEINFSDQVVYILYNELEYENVLKVSRNTKGQFISGGFGGAKPSLGVTMDKKVKRIGCSALKDLIENKQLLCFDADTIAEFSTFIQIKESFGADEGYHDDMVMTLVTFAWATTCPGFKNLTDSDVRVEMHRSRMEHIENEMLPIGWVNDGVDFASGNSSFNF